jgi:hypothetical protein
LFEAMALFLVRDCAGATRLAASCSLADVTAAYNLAGSGDIVSVPACTATPWTSYLTISKSITIQGAGGGQTVITNGGTTKLFYINLSSDVPVRITGFYFTQDLHPAGEENAVYINGKKDNSFPLTKVRIDNNYFYQGVDVIWATGWLECLIDHNTFYNADRAIIVIGDDDYAWNRTIAAGTSHALFIEDNTFLADNKVTWIFNENLYQQQGARTVVRYNNFDFHACTVCTAFYDSHGNGTYYTGGTDFRGQPILEIYNNTFHSYNTYSFGDFRGGSFLIWGNSFIEDTGAAKPWKWLSLTEEEDYLKGEGHFSPLRTQWPAQDQVNNSFLWNNTLCDNSSNCIAITDIVLNTPNSSCTAASTPYACCTGNGTGTCDDVFLQKDRDYFMHAPASSGGKASYTGSRAGGSTTAPTTDDTGSMSFSSSGANAYYPYTPFVYPHPLQSSLSAPQNLRVVK